MSSAPRLTPNDWTEAALEAMARTGTTGVNVEQLAKSLDTTKGSFYHHFKNRQALLDAALARWEEIVAGDLEASNAVVDPYARLITSSIAGVEGGLNGFVDLALAASLDDESVAASVHRVNQTRLDFLTTILTEMGLTPVLARERAVRALSGYLGLYQLQRSLAETFDQGRVIAQITALVDDMVRT